MLSVLLAIWVNLIGICLQQVAAVPFHSHSHRQLPQDSTGSQIVDEAGLVSPLFPDGVLGSPITLTIVRTLTSSYIDTILGLPTFTVFTTTSTVTITTATSTTTTTFLFTPTPSLSTTTASTIIFKTVETVIVEPSPVSILPTPTPSTAADNTSESSLKSKSNGSTAMLRNWRSGVWVYSGVVIGAMLIT